MPHRNDNISLRHMLDHAREAAQLIEGKEREDLDRDRVLSLALVRLLEVVGEAAHRLSAHTRDRYTQVPWPQIIALRNRLIHGYDSVDHDVVWAIVKNDLPPLITQLESILRENE